MEVSTASYALVVDDDALILTDACDTFEQAGFRSYEASCGDEAETLLVAHA